MMPTIELLYILEVRRLIASKDIIDSATDDAYHEAFERERRLRIAREEIWSILYPNAERRV